MINFIVVTLKRNRELPGDQVLRTLHFHCLGSISCWGNLRDLKPCSVTKKKKTRKTTKTLKTGKINLYRIIYLN